MFKPSRAYSLIAGLLNLIHWDPDIGDKVTTGYRYVPRSGPPRRGQANKRYRRTVSGACQRRTARSRAKRKAA